jgi:dihydroflavonol-4-reductase
MVLVSGATRHIGNVLVRQLPERGKKVSALILSTEDHRPFKDLRVEVLEANILDLTSLFKSLRGVH